MPDRAREGRFMWSSVAAYTRWASDPDYPIPNNYCPSIAEGECIPGEDCVFVYSFFLG